MPRAEREIGENARFKRGVIRLLFPRRESLDAYREEIRAFVRGELEELSAEVERTGRAPPDLWNRLAARSLLRLTLPPPSTEAGVSA